MSKVLKQPKGLFLKYTFYVSAMALKCIIISANDNYNPLIQNFLGRARFLEKAAVLPSFDKAKKFMRQEAFSYIMLDLLSCPAEIAALDKSDFPNCRIVLFSREDVFMLEPLPDDISKTLLSDEPQGTPGESLEPGFRLHLGSRDMTLELRAEETRVLLDQVPMQVTENNDSLFVKAESKISRIDKKDILFVESQKDYIVFHTAEQEIRVLSRMKNIAQRLGNREFMRIHRSFLVRIDQIETIEQDRVYLQGHPKPLPVGPSYKNVLMETLQLV